MLIIEDSSRKTKQVQLLYNSRLLFQVKLMTQDHMTVDKFVRLREKKILMFFFFFFKVAVNILQAH